MSQQKSRSEEENPRTIAFTISLIFLVISFLLSLFELVNVNAYLSQHEGWGGITGAGLPWLASLAFLFIASSLVFGIFWGFHRK